MIYLYAQFGRRGMMIEYILLFIAMIVLRLRTVFLTIRDRIWMYFAGMLMAMMVFSLGSLITNTYIFERGGFSKSAVEESRGSVFNDFFFDFNTSSDWLLGRGLEGRVLRSINLEEGTSDVIENGFLTVILKGGLLYLLSSIFIFLKASYLGLFRSNNDVAKALAILILIYVVMMAYFNIPTYSTKYFFTWMSAAVLLSSEYRQYSNLQMFYLINTFKPKM
jgi:hypothetical protein